MSFAIKPDQPRPDRDSPILLLDEPSASLDPASEESIVEGLARLLQGRTSVTIAHRADHDGAGLGRLVRPPAQVTPRRATSIASS